MQKVQKHVMDVGRYLFCRFSEVILCVLLRDGIPQIELLVTYVLPVREFLGERNYEWQEVLIYKICRKVNCWLVDYIGWLCREPVIAVSWWYQTRMLWSVGVASCGVDSCWGCCCFRITLDLDVSRSPWCIVNKLDNGGFRCLLKILRTLIKYVLSEKSTRNME